MPTWVIFYAFTEPMLTCGPEKKLSADGNLAKISEKYFGDDVSH